jgi:hypothetical protein
MKAAIINKARYTIFKTGYGQYEITKSTKRKAVTIHSNDSQIYDWIDDDSEPKKYSYARRKLRNLFKA